MINTTKNTVVSGKDTVPAQNVERLNNNLIQAIATVITGDVRNSDKQQRLVPKIGDALFALYGAEPFLTLDKLSNTERRAAYDSNKELADLKFERDRIKNAAINKGTKAQQADEAWVQRVTDTGYVKWTRIVQRGIAQAQAAAMLPELKKQQVAEMDKAAADLKSAMIAGDSKAINKASTRQATIGKNLALIERDPVAAAKKLAVKSILTPAQFRKKQVATLEAVVKKIQEFENPDKKTMDALKQIQAAVALMK